MRCQPSCTRGRKMRYEVVLFKTDEGYAVTCPALPGCWSQGATRDEALENISDAISLYLDYQSEKTEARKERLIQEGKDEGLPVELHNVVIADPAVV